MKLRNVTIHYLTGPRGEWIQSNTPPFAASGVIDVMNVNIGWVIMVKGLIHRSLIWHQFSKGQWCCGLVGLVGQSAYLVNRSTGFISQQCLIVGVPWWFKENVVKYIKARYRIISARICN